MPSELRILVHGASGRMGATLLRLARGDGLEVVAAVARRAPADRPEVAWFTPDRLIETPDFDVAIDFSLPEAFDGILRECTRRRVPLVSGTTGLSEVQLTAMHAASSEIPLLWAANFSLGVAVLADLVERASKLLAGWDCDIVESHHAHKKDAPSGTALALGARAEAGGSHPRFASVRAGDIVGEHTVQLATAGERIELIHRATNRDVFARGALHVARRLVGRAPGTYVVADLLG